MPTIIVGCSIELYRMSNLHTIMDLTSTNNIEKVFNKKERKTIGLLICAIIVAIINGLGLQFSVAVIDIFLSMSILQECIKTKRLKKDLEDVQDNCKSILNHQNSDEIPTEGDVIRVIIKYETALSYASILMDSKEFARKQSKLTEEWVEIKKRYDIK